MSTTLSFLIDENISLKKLQQFVALDSEKFQICQRSPLYSEGCKTISANNQNLGEGIEFWEKSEAHYSDFSGLPKFLSAERLKGIIQIIKIKKYSKRELAVTVFADIADRLDKYAKAILDFGYNISAELIMGELELDIPWHTIDLYNKKILLKNDIHLLAVRKDQLKKFGEFNQEELEMFAAKGQYLVKK